MLLNKQAIFGGGFVEGWGVRFASPPPSMFTAFFKSEICDTRKLATFSYQWTETKCLCDRFDLSLEAMVLLTSYLYLVFPPVVSLTV